MSPRGSVHNLLWQLVPVRDYLNAERMLAATGFTPLLVNLESMTSKPNAGGGSKDCVAWKVVMASHYFVHADKVTTDLGKMAAVAGGLSHMGRGAAPLKTSTQVFEHFQAPGNPDQHETTVVKDFN